MELIFPTREMKQAAMDFRQEHFDNNEPKINGSAGFAYVDNYEEWLAKIERDVTHSNKLVVPATVYFAVIDDEIVGILQIRHELNEHLLNSGGHVGYNVRPFQRRKGYATKMLALALTKCRDMDINQALVTCNKDNEASRRTILRNGGVLENEFTEDCGNIVERYWISL
ncbi:MAG: GNAT family N-acetyltransferase [Defluviitaleaceae bacterium]|nr:GNAT family N-acetyltransferase [Defluviitaleaceae bacterium]